MIKTGDIELNKEEIAKILNDAEDVVHDDTESEYKRKMAKEIAYEQIIELLKGESK